VSGFLLVFKTNHLQAAKPLQNALWLHLCIVLLQIQSIKSMADQNTLQTQGSTTDTAPRLNREVELILASGKLLIEQDFGLRVLNQYLSEIEQLRAGVPFSQLGMSIRREASLPKLIVESAAGVDIISDAYILRNQKLTPVGSVALIPLIGAMQTEDGACSYGMRSIAQNLRYAYANDNISAIIMEANSGGGEAKAMYLMQSVLSERNKPVIGFAQFAASAAYGTIAATDEVIADGNGAEFGSIGGMVSVNKAFLEYYKENFITFYGGNAPKKNDEMRKALDGDFEPLQAIADETTDQFHAKVLEMRPLTGGESYRKQTLSGAMFSALEAKRRGLVDGIGNIQYALKRAKAWEGKYKK
jgi:ClpP class serine protease